MMIDTSPWSSCSRQSPWLSWSSHKISSTGPSVSPFRDFYIEICKMQKLFSSPFFLRSTPRLYLRTNLSRPVLTLFLDQSFVSDSNTFFRPNIFEREPFFRLETDTESFFRDRNSQRKEKSLDIEKS